MRTESIRQSIGKPELGLLWASIQGDICDHCTHTPPVSAETWLAHTPFPHHSQHPPAAAFPLAAAAAAAAAFVVVVAAAAAAVAASAAAAGSAAAVAVSAGAAAAAAAVAAAAGSAAAVAASTAAAAVVAASFAASADSAALIALQKSCCQAAVHAELAVKLGQAHASARHHLESQSQRVCWLELADQLWPRWPQLWWAGAVTPEQLEWKAVMQLKKKAQGSELPFVLGLLTAQGF